MQIDIYCRVIDNWGDAGVCWRLARHLVTKQKAQVRLIIDEPKTLALLGAQSSPNLAICDWLVEVNGPEFAKKIPHIIIAAFGCELPPKVRAALATSNKKTLWINLEYLSAEPWTQSHHWLPSIKPDRACEMFYMPGFTTKTGGVLTEELATPSPEALIAQLALQPRHSQERWASVFCYSNASIAALKKVTTPWRLLVPEAVASNIETIIESSSNLTVQRIAHLSQLEYDTLLNLCDFNFVRGEDSWVRAQLAGKPFIWQPYVQDDNAHQGKLTAFINLVESATAAKNPAWRAASLAWSGLYSTEAAFDGHPLADLLNGNSINWQTQQQFFIAWREKLLKNDPLCAQIVSRYQHWARIQGLAKIS